MLLSVVLCSDRSVALAERDPSKSYYLRCCVRFPRLYELLCAFPDRAALCAPSLGGKRRAAIGALLWILSSQTLPFFWPGQPRFTEIIGKFGLGYSTFSFWAVLGNIGPT